MSKKTDSPSLLKTESSERETPAAKAANQLKKLREEALRLLEALPVSEPSKRDVFTNAIEVCDDVDRLRSLRKILLNLPDRYRQGDKWIKFVERSLKALQIKQRASASGSAEVFVPNLFDPKNGELFMGLPSDGESMEDDAWYSATISFIPALGVSVKHGSVGDKTRLWVPNRETEAHILMGAIFEELIAIDVRDWKRIRGSTTSIATQALYYTRQEMIRSFVSVNGIPKSLIRPEHHDFIFSIESPLSTLVEKFYSRAKSGDVPSVRKTLSLIIRWYVERRFKHVAYCIERRILHDWASLYRSQKRTVKKEVRVGKKKKGKPLLMVTNEPKDCPRPSELVGTFPFEKASIQELYESPWRELKETRSKFEKALEVSIELVYSQSNLEVLQQCVHDVSRSVRSQWEAKAELWRRLRDRNRALIPEYVRKGDEFNFLRNLRKEVKDIETLANRGLMPLVHYRDILPKRQVCLEGGFKHDSYLSAYIADKDGFEKAFPDTFKYIEEYTRVAEKYITLMGAVKTAPLGVTKPIH